MVDFTSPKRRSGAGNIALFVAAAILLFVVLYALLSGGVGTVTSDMPVPAGDAAITPDNNPPVTGN